MDAEYRGLAVIYCSHTEASLRQYRDNFSKIRQAEVYVRMFIFMQPCVHVCACFRCTLVCLFHLHMRTCNYACKMHIHICVYIYIRMCTCSCACVRVCTHVYDYALCLGQLHYATTCVFERYVCNSQALVYTI